MQKALLQKRITSLLKAAQKTCQDLWMWCFVQPPAKLRLSKKSFSALSPLLGSWVSGLHILDSFLAIWQTIRGYFCKWLGTLQKMPKQGNLDVDTWLLRNCHLDIITCLCWVLFIFVYIHTNTKIVGIMQSINIEQQGYRAYFYLTCGRLPKGLVGF